MLVKDAVSVVTVQQYGCSVITSVVAHWIVINRISPKDFDVAQLSTETTTAQCKANVVIITFITISCMHAGKIYLLKLCNELQFTLNRQELLAHVIWDIVCTYNKSQVILLHTLYSVYVATVQTEDFCHIHTLYYI